MPFNIVIRARPKRPSPPSITNSELQHHPPHTNQQHPRPPLIRAHVPHPPNCTRKPADTPSMLSRRIVAARPLPRAALRTTTIPQFTQRRTALTAAERAELADPGMNGGYINPPAEKRMNRDPYADWWDKQDRRNYGEPCHEDHDILGAVSLHDYNHFKPGFGGLLFGTFVLTVIGLCVAVNQVYPDKISAPKTYPDGLEVELGGKGALSVS